MRAERILFVSGLTLACIFALTALLQANSSYHTTERYLVQGMFPIVSVLEVLWVSSAIPVLLVRRPRRSYGLWLVCTVNSMIVSLLIYTAFHN